MTENRRIFLNVVATYGRSIYSLVLGLLCGRWTLMALGETDYGLNGLVGGLTVFISFFNGVLAGANSRFYAFSIGAAKIAKDKAAALEECRHWFNTAFSIHTSIPIVLIAIGYPIGVYAIEHWLTIPADRITACIWVFRFVCISCFFGMLNVPFRAMYGAKQYIAELTIYSFVTSTLNVVFLHYMVTHPGVWLAKFAAFGCVLSVVPQIIICIRAVYIFPECKINFKYMWEKERLKKIGGFSMWTFLGVLCSMLRSQGISIVINKFFGATMNAAQAIGKTVQGQCYTLAGAMQSAFTPVITQACGAKNFVKMNKFVLRTSKFNIFLALIFVIPLAIELKEVMILWLKNPPEFSIGLCYCAMILHLVRCCTTGHMIAVNATGDIKAYHIVLTSVNVLTVPFSILAGLIWKNVYLIIGVVIFMESINSLGRIYYAHKLCGTSIWKLIKEVFLPIMIVSVASVAIGIIPQFFMNASFIRVCITTLACEVVFLPLTWFLILSKEEQLFVIEKFEPQLKKLLLLFHK